MTTISKERLKVLRGAAAGLALHGSPDGADLLTLLNAYERAPPEPSALAAAMQPFVALAEIFDHPAGNRPFADEDEIHAWEDHRVKGQRAMTVGDLRKLRHAATGIAYGRADTPEVAAAMGRLCGEWDRSTGIRRPPPGIYRREQQAVWGHGYGAALRGEAKQGTEGQTLMGIPITADPTMPEGGFEIRTIPPGAKAVSTNGVVLEVARNLGRQAGNVLFALEQKQWGEGLSAQDRRIIRGLLENVQSLGEGI